MLDRLDAVLDHVAVAVPDQDLAQSHWREELGGRTVAWGDNGVFQSHQLRFAGGGKLELLSPADADPAGDNFVRRFLARFGSTVHHVTLKVPDLPAALATLERAGLDVVDVRLDGAHWREGFLRPKQVGGIVVQVAWSDRGDAEWAALIGHEAEAPPPDAATLLGPTLRHPDLDTAAEQWRLLGADVAEEDGALLCRWPSSPLTVALTKGEPAGPTGLRMTGHDGPSTS